MSTVVVIYNCTSDAAAFFASITFFAGITFRASRTSIAFSTSCTCIAFRTSRASCTCIAFRARRTSSAGSTSRTTTDYAQGVFVSAV